MGQAFAAAPLLTSLALASTAVSVGSSIFSGMQESRALKEQRRAEEQRAKQASIQGLQEGNQILRDQLSAIAQVNLAAGASGIDPFSGTPENTVNSIRETADRQLRTTALNTQFELASSSSRGRQLSIQGSSAQARGLFGAGGSLLDLSTRVTELGVPGG